MRSLYPWPLFPINADPRASRSLCLQFIIQEWISSFAPIEALEKKEGKLHTLAEDVQKLMLFSMDCPFSKKPGTLDKICFYLQELLAGSKIPRLALFDNPEKWLDRMQDVLLGVRSQLMAWKQSLPSFDHVLDFVQDLCGKLRSCLFAFFHTLIPFFEEAKSDENVLFFLIEHKREINSILQSSTQEIRFHSLEQLFRHLYPAGPTHLRTTLCDGYTRRGFAEFYVQHKTVIESVEWLAEECMTTSS